jgi:hypothetical protein
MKIAPCFGRVGGLAIALGTGALLAAVPWSAAADPDTSGLAALSDLLGPAAADPSGLNLAISYDGMNILQMGDATANSGNDSLAIAYGAGSTADSGTWTDAANGDTATGSGDYAFADGANSTAVATGTDFDSATAADGGTAYSGLIVEPGGYVIAGTDGYDVAHATGAGSVADAGGDLYDSATASGGGTADAGFLQSTIPGLGDFGGGESDSATADGAGSVAQAGFGNDNIADVFGNGSNAIAGGLEGSTDYYAGSNDIAEAFGNGLTANASGGSDLSEFISPFGSFALPEAAAAVPSDDFGLSSLGLEGLAPGLESLLNLF